MYFDFSIFNLHETIGLTFLQTFTENRLLFHGSSPFSPKTPNRATLPLSLSLARSPSLTLQVPPGHRIVVSAAARSLAVVVVVPVRIPIASAVDVGFEFLRWCCVRCRSVFLVCGLDPPFRSLRESIPQARGPRIPGLRSILFGSGVFPPVSVGVCL